MKSILRKHLGFFYRYGKKTIGSNRLERSVKKGTIRIIIGAEKQGISNGWIPTDVEYLSLLEQKDWQRYFTPSSIEAILAEHVWEHLTREEGMIAARMCFKYLKRPGHVRVAVPDGLHPDSAYIERVRPNGSGAGAADHKILYTFEALQKTFEMAGFSTDLLEYFDKAGEFHCKEWNVGDGFIRRSKKFDKRNSERSLSYTSLILDAHKR